MIMFSAVAGGALGLLVQHPLSGPECTAKDCFVTGSVLVVFHVRLESNFQSYFLLLEFMTWLLMLSDPRISKFTVKQTSMYSSLICVLELDQILKSTYNSAAQAPWCIFATCSTGCASSKFEPVLYVTYIFAYVRQTKLVFVNMPTRSGLHKVVCRYRNDLCHF